jgi:hypothetical protein
MKTDDLKKNILKMLRGTRALKKHSRFVSEDSSETEQMEQDVFRERARLWSTRLRNAIQTLPLMIKAKLHGYVMFPAELLCLRLRVPPYQVSTCVALEVPWRHQDNVSFPYPDASLHHAADTAQTFMSVLTLDTNTVETEKFNGYA